MEQHERCRRQRHALRQSSTLVTVGQDRQTRAAAKATGSYLLVHYLLPFFVRQHPLLRCFPWGKALLFPHILR
jgi:hypothetical protein